MDNNLKFCGSAHCRKKIHRWLDKGTEFARLSSENCGAQTDRTPEQLRESEETSKAIIKKILSK